MRKKTSPKFTRRPSSSSSSSSSSSFSSSVASSIVSLQRRQRRQLLSILILRYAGFILMPCMLYMCIHLMQNYSSPQGRARRVLLSSSNTKTNNNQQQSQCFSENIIAYMYQSSLTTKDNLRKSLQLLHDNYLLLNNNDNVDVIIFHTGELQQEDFLLQEAEKKEWTNVRLVTIQHDLPKAVAMDKDPSRTWIDYPNVSLDRRHEHHFWSIGIWEYLTQQQQEEEEEVICRSEPRYLWRMDTNAFLYSPIPYNLFDFMKNNNYQYSFRLCHHQRQQQRQQQQHSVWEELSLLDNNAHEKKNDNDYFDNCQMDDSFLLADVHFFKSRLVQKWLEFLRVGGYIYRQNLSPSIIHQLVLQAYSTASKSSSSSSIHRFLDFTLLHAVDSSTECCQTEFQAGYADVDGQAHIEEWLYYYYLHHEREQKKKNGTGGNTQQKMEPRIEYPTHAQLTPRLTHLPKQIAQTIQLPTLVVE